MSTAEILDFSAMREEERFKADDRLYVIFYKGAIKDGFRSEQEGRPIFKDVDFIKIFVPGDKNSVIERPVEENDKNRFASRWEKYLKKQDGQYASGTPLNMWPQLTPSQIAEMNAMNIFTVEQLAELPDGFAQKILGAHELRRRAKVFLDVSRKDGEAQALAEKEAKSTAENEELKARIAVLEKALLDKKIEEKPASDKK